MEGTGELVVSRTLAESFVFDVRIAETPWAELYKVVSNQTGKSYALWVGKHPLDGTPDASSTLHRRFSQLPSLFHSSLTFIAGGVDVMGYPFLAFSPVFGAPLTAVGIEEREAERRFTLALRCVEGYHQNYLYLGDLCPDSFWVHKDGTILLFGLLGVYQQAALDLRSSPSGVYVAPEILTGQSRPTAQSDVFSCGVLLHYLMSNALPFYQDGKLVLQLEKSRKRVPRWVASVVERCIAPNPSERFPNAAALVAGIIEAKEKILAEESTLVDQSKVAAAIVGTREFIDEHGEKFSESEYNGADMSRLSQSLARPKSSPLLKILVGAFALGVFVAGAAFLRDYIGVSVEQQQFKSALDKRLEGVADSKLKEAVSDLQSAEKTVRDGALATIIADKSAASFGLLVDAVIHADTPDRRMEYALALIKRLRQDGMTKSATVLSQLFQSHSASSPLNDFELAFRGLNKELPDSEASNLFSQSYQVTPPFTLRLASAASVDRLPESPYLQVLQEMVGLTMDKTDLTGRSVLAVVMAHPELAIYARDVLSKFLHTIPDSDILWILDLLVSRRDPAVTEVAQEIANRGLVGGYRKEFLAPLQIRGDLPPAVTRALVKGMRGELRVEEVRSIGEWYDQLSEKLLWVVCKEYLEPDVVEAAFNSLTSQSISSPLAKEFVDWIKQEQWKERSKFIGLATNLFFIDSVDQEELSRSLDVLESVKDKRKLLASLIELGGKRIALPILDKFGSSLNLGQLLPLLGNKSKQVRLEAIRRLAEYNDIGVIGMVVEAYERERDPEVRQKYQESFWTIREREEKRKKLIQEGAVE